MASRTGPIAIAAGGAFSSQKSTNVTIQARGLAGDVGGELRSQFRFTVPRKLLSVSGNRSQRGAQLERHLGGNFTVQLLLVADLLKLGAIADQASGSDQASIAGGDGRNRHRNAKLNRGGSGVVSLDVAALATLAKHGIHFFGEATLSVPQSV